MKCDVLPCNEDAELLARYPRSMDSDYRRYCNECYLDIQSRGYFFIERVRSL